MSVIDAKGSLADGFHCVQPILPPPGAKSRMGRAPEGETHQALPMGFTAFNPSYPPV